MALSQVWVLAPGAREIIPYQFGITHFTWSAAQAGWCLRSISHPV